MARARNFRGRSSAPRRQVTWIGPADQGYITVAAGGATILGSFDPIAAGMDKPTIVRTRGFVGIVPLSYTADLTVTGAFGVGVVSTQAFAAGIASVPEPFDEADWDGWFVWRSFAFEYEFQDSTGSFLSTFGLEVDSKAMRKVSANETMVLVGQSESGAFKIAPHIRALLKLA